MTYSDLAIAVIGMALSFGLGVGAGVLLMRDRLRAALDAANKRIAEYRASQDVLQATIAGWESWYNEHMPKCRSLAASNERGRAALAEWEIDHK